MLNNKLKYIPHASIGLVLMAASIVAAQGNGDSVILSEPDLGCDYVVSSGESLSVIARDNDVSLAQLVKWNKIDNENFIRTGDQICVDDPFPFGNSYTPATESATEAQPGAINLMDYLLARYNEASNLGIYNDRSTRGGSRLSVHAEGRALDVAFENCNAMQGYEAANYIVENSTKMGVQYLLWCDIGWSVERGWFEPTSGQQALHSNPAHIHAEMTPEAAANFTSEMMAEPVVEEAVAPAAPTETQVAAMVIEEVVPEVVFVDTVPATTNGDFAPTPDVLQVINGYFGDLGPEVVTNALKIARCESGYNPKASNLNSNSSNDFGLFQINEIHEDFLRGAGLIESLDDLYDPSTNAKAARLLFDRDGFSPWLYSSDCSGVPA